MLSHFGFEVYFRPTGPLLICQWCISMFSALLESVAQNLLESHKSHLACESLQWSGCDCWQRGKTAPYVNIRLLQTLKKNTHIILISIYLVSLVVRLTQKLYLIKKAFCHPSCHTCISWLKALKALCIFAHIVRMGASEKVRKITHWSDQNVAK